MGQPEMTPLMMQVLAWCLRLPLGAPSREPMTIDAAVYADAIVRCMQAGWLQLEGTLSSARLLVTRDGRLALEAAEQRADGRGFSRGDRE